MEIQIKNVQFKLEAIHAERLPNPQASNVLNIIFNVSIGSNFSIKGEVVELPFTISITSTPPILSISLRGSLILQLSQSDIDKLSKLLSEGKVPAQIQTLITQYAIFESGLIARELGLPPIIPIQLQHDRNRGVEVKYYA